MLCARLGCKYCGQLTKFAKSDHAVNWNKKPYALSSTPSRNKINVILNKKKPIFNVSQHIMKGQLTVNIN